MANISIAPMMGYTDKHFRVLARLLSSDLMLYTQMIVADSLKYNPKVINAFGIDHSLGHVVLQLGGSNVESLVNAGQIAKDFGYKEINLNVGCPSSKVKLGGIGVCLLKTPDIVAKCVHALKQISNIKVTVKTRVGVDDVGGFDYLCDFIKQLRNVGCDGVIFHARKAWLNGLSPKDNRTVPPLDYCVVKKLRAQFNDYYIGINGGITNYSQGVSFIDDFSEVMIGRQGYKNLQLCVNLIKKDNSYLEVSHCLNNYLSYAANSNEPMHHILKHCMSLHYACYASSMWRKCVANAMNDPSDKNLNRMIELSSEIDSFYQ